MEKEAVTDEPLESARGHYEAGAYKACRDAALAGLAEHADDPELLRLAGKASVELDLDDAEEYLRKVVALRPDEARGWDDLGEALAADGRMSDATDAFRRALALNPEDERALMHLGHTAAATGERDDAISYLTQAAAQGRASSSALISLVEMYKSVGQPEEALAAALKIAEAQPDDVTAALDVAELTLSLGRLDEAAAAFERLRDVDDMPDHDVYALHGGIRVEIAREAWDRALSLAREAAGVDPYGRTRDVLAFLEARASGPGEDPVPTRAEVDGALAASEAEHRRVHAEDARLESQEFA